MGTQGFVYEPDISDPNYWRNWYVQLEWFCVKPVYIGMIYTLMRITEGVVGLMLAGIVDRIGRKKSAQLFIAISLIAQSIIIFTPSYYGKLFGYMLMGCATTKNSISYVWIFEMVESKYKSWCCSFVNTVDTLTMVVTGLYILFISKNWLPLEVTMWFIGICNLTLISTLMPESPKWLLITGKISEAIQQFNYIAKFNNSTKRIPENAQFIEAVLCGFDRNEEDPLEISPGRLTPNHDI